MRPLMLASAVVLAGAAAGVAQTLVCPPVSTATTSCDTYHFHVAMYRPDTRGFSEVYGANQYATQSACERARDAAIRRNSAVVDFFHRVRNDDRWQADKFGPCHCDMTVEKTSPNYLTDVQRMAQVKLEDDVRQRVRERLLDADLTSDNELVRSVTAVDPVPPILGGAKFVTLPQTTRDVPPSRSPNDIRMSRVVDASQQQVAAIELPLVEIPLPGVAATIDAPSPTPSVAVVAEPAPAPVPQTQPQPAPAPPPAPAPATPAPEPAKPLPTVTVEAPPAPAPDDAAEAFVNFETKRIQNVLSASAAVADEELKSKVLEACVQRIQVLSNLRSLIDGSGAKSRLAAATRDANDETARLGLVVKLFGADMLRHWAPKDAADVVVDTSGDAAAAERVLRDAASTAPQKRHALYLLLAKSQPTEQQQLWLTGVIDGLLQ